MYPGFGHLVESGAFSYRMPNPYNVAWDFSVVQILFFLGYVPGFPKLYLYMLKQRKNTLGSKEKRS